MPNKACARNVGEMLGEPLREVVVATEDHAAPLGALLRDERVVLRPFTNTRILSAILRSGWFTVNIVIDALVFYRVLNGSLRPGHRGVIEGSCGSIFCVLEEARIRVPRSTIIGRPLEYRINCCPAGFSRANSMLLELLVAYTKIPVLLSKGLGSKAYGEYLRALEAYRVIVRTGDRTEYAEVAEDLLRDVKEVMEQLIG